MSWRRRLLHSMISGLRCCWSALLRITVDWDTSQADDFRTRGVPWTIKRRLLERGRALRSDRSGVYRHQRTMLQPQRRGPLGAMSDDGLTATIQGVLAASPFHGEGHRKVWARLRYAETRTSLRRVLRLMRQNNLLAPTRVGSP